LIWIQLKQFLDQQNTFIVVARRTVLCIIYLKKSLQYFFISSPVSIGAGSSTFVPLSPRVALILNKLIEIRRALVSEELLLAVAPSVRPKRVELHPQKCILHWNFLMCIFPVLSIVLHKSSLIS
jgi:hypothetical protein